MIKSLEEFLREIDDRACDVSSSATRYFDYGLIEAHSIKPTRLIYCAHRGRDGGALGIEPVDGTAQPRDMDAEQAHSLRFAASAR